MHVFVNRVHVFFNYLPYLGFPIIFYNIQIEKAHYSSEYSLQKNIVEQFFLANANLKRV